LKKSSAPPPPRWRGKSASDPLRFHRPKLADAPQTYSWKLDGTPWTIHNHANVFARSGLDIGARFFLQHLPSDLEGEIADLGCGNGVIGLQALAQNPNASVMFTDESHMAVASSRLNVERNLPDDIARCEFMVNNSLSGIEPTALRRSCVIRRSISSTRLPTILPGRCLTMPAAA
jgi:16S rRNA G1207 methylase RsmC